MSFKITIPILDPVVRHQVPLPHFSRIAPRKCHRDPSCREPSYRHRCAPVKRMEGSDSWFLQDSSPPFAAAQSHAKTLQPVIPRWWGFESPQLPWQISLQTNMRDRRSQSTELGRQLEPWLSLTLAFAPAGARWANFAFPMGDRFIFPCPILIFSCFDIARHGCLRPSRCRVPKS